MFTTGIVLKICMQHTKSVYQLYNKQPKPMIFGVEAGVFGVEASTPTPPTPLDKTLPTLRDLSKEEHRKLPPN